MKSITRTICICRSRASSGFSLEGRGSDFSRLRRVLDVSQAGKSDRVPAMIAKTKVLRDVMAFLAIATRKGQKTASWAWNLRIGVSDRHVPNRGIRLVRQHGYIGNEVCTLRGTQTAWSTARGTENPRRLDGDPHRLL